MTHLLQMLGLTELAHYCLHHGLSLYVRFELYRSNYEIKRLTSTDISSAAVFYIIFDRWKAMDAGVHHSQHYFQDSEQLEDLNKFSARAGWQAYFVFPALHGKNRKKLGCRAQGHGRSRGPTSLLVRVTEKERRGAEVTTQNADLLISCQDQ